MAQKQRRFERKAREKRNAREYLQPQAAVKRTDRRNLTEHQQEKKLQTADEHGNAAHQSVHLRDEVRRLDRVDYDRASRNVDDRAEAEALTEEHGREDGCRACDSGRCAVGHAGSQRHALLQHAPRFESDICLQHHRNADRADRNTQDQPEQPAHVIVKHESILLLSD